MKSLIRFCLALSLLLIVAMPGTAPVHGHGVILEYSVDETTGEVTVRAAFDTGEALDEAQVAIFAPDDLVNPWLTGFTDAVGHFVFSPDYSIEGVWDVQVRKAGHGGLLRVPLDASMAPPVAGSETTDDTAGTVQAADGTRIVITGDAQFVVAGDIVIQANGTVAGQTGSGSPTPAQIVIMSVSVVWGFVGTALYFSRGRRRTEST